MSKSLATVVALALAAASASSQSAVQPTNDLSNPYATVENYFKLPAGRTWGATSAVDVDRDGKSIWVAERCGANTCAGSDLPVVLKFDESGKLVRSFGAGMFVFPHGIHVDRDGNVWVTDERAATPDELKKFPKANDKGHTVVKFSPEGKVLMTLGMAGMSGDPGGHLDEPCDVITNASGDIFVAEGHSGQNAKAAPTTTARISKFDRTGKFIKSWGKWGAGPGEFKTPHALAFDSRGRLIVADRGNLRLQVFDQDGRFLEETRQFSRVSGLFVDRNDMLYAADSESSPTSNPGGWKRGIRIGSTKDLKVQYFIPDTAEPKGTTNAEGVAVDAAGHVYGAEVGPMAVKKYVRR